MSRKLAVVALVATILAVPVHSMSLPNGTRVERYKGGLNFPVDMAWVKGTKKVFFTEKDSGKIRVMLGRRVLKRACVKLDVNSSGERGLLGITLHPKFKRNHQLYVFYTNAVPLDNRVTRFTVRNNRCTAPRNIMTGVNASSSGYHNGGQLEFAGGKLFVSTGEAHDPGLAQDRGNRLGKILRYNPNGSIPKGNPGTGNPVWSFGHRNPFGLAHKPGSSKLYSTENGPGCDDELNKIERGRNYGWGDNYRCGTAGVGPNPKAPLRRWSDVIVPTDATWYRGRMKSLSGSLYVGSFYDGLHRIVLNKAGNRLRADRKIHNASDITDVSKGPGGWLYFLTTGGMFRIVPR